MKLLTQEILKNLPPLYSSENEPDPLCRVKFFHPMSSLTRYRIEYSPEERIFFGYVDSPDPELGYFSLDEMEECVIYGLGVERDQDFQPRRLSEIKEEIRKRGTK
jgi:hypothetical protein